MKIDYENIRNTYGDTVIEDLKENIDTVMSNIEYLKKIGFTDIESIFERYTLLFLYNTIEFKNKFNYLVNKYGNNYVDIIENDLFLLEEIL